VELQESYERIIAELADDAEVLDVGGWSRPFWRANWVIDLEGYDTRGLYQRCYATGEDLQAGEERFTAATWVLRDICDREPWPFADDQFDFAVCAQTLEDVRDPVWVCAELSRVARAGYVEVPNRLQEQSWGVQGPWTGWSHHRWLIDVEDGRMDFLHKPAFVHTRASCQFPAGFAVSLPPAESQHAVWWDGAIEARERMIFDAAELDAYVEDLVTEERARRGLPPARERPDGAIARVARRLRPA
jgi:methyltransferase family protein